MDSSRHSPEGPPAGQRLGSWKEIAAYLDRRPRTVQRWEKTEGLPVHRHVHEALATVYAYTAELDAWQKSRGALLRAEEVKSSVVVAVPIHPRTRALDGFALRAAGSVTTSPKPNRGLKSAIAVCVLALFAGGAVWWQRAWVKPLTDQDVLVLADLNNNTGDPQFDGTLRQVLSFELEESL